MLPSEFSDRFDVLLNSYANSGLFGQELSHTNLTFDEYEKSVFLTKAQEECAVGLYNGKNPYGDSFEETEEIRRYLANLVKEVSLSPITNTNGSLLGMNSGSVFFTLPENLLFITYEAVEASNTDCKGRETVQDVYPAKQDEYHKLRRNPFRGANSRRALRFDLSEGVVEIVSKFPVQKYYVRYLSKPHPIVLTDLTTEGLNVEGETHVSGSELPEVLHSWILEMAVRLALQSKGAAHNEKRDKE